MWHEVTRPIQPALKKQWLGLLMFFCKITRMHLTSSIWGKMTSLCYKNAMSALNHEDTTKDISFIKTASRSTFRNNKRLIKSPLVLIGQGRVWTDEFSVSNRTFVSFLLYWCQLEACSTIVEQTVPLLLSDSWVAILLSSWMDQNLPHIPDEKKERVVAALTDIRSHPDFLSAEPGKPQSSQWPQRSCTWRCLP